ncbi:MAG TPA: serine hydrolase [Rhizomicrobium sp.]|nr:serine hydrolase [Rhizomicrobium sp.]
MFGRQRAASGATAWKSISAAFTLALSLACLFAPGTAYARHHHGGGSAASGSLTEPDKDAALVVDGVSGHVLYARNASAERHPASLTKMMTLYMLFDAFKRGQANLGSMIPVSEHASIQHRTKLFLRPGDQISADTAIRAIVVLSANDVAVAISEFLGGTEDHFGEMMTARARQLGMTGTFYHNASGLPDDRQLTTANDLAILARHLAYDYPQYFHYFSTPSFVYRGRFYATHDNLIGHYEGADGMKTGYTEASGFNLVSSVTRSGMHIIGVVMGGRTAHLRDIEMVRLLDATFAQIQQNPGMVSRANFPWQTMAANEASPAVAGFEVGMPHGQVQSDDPEDEESAESRADPQDAIGNLIAQSGTPRPNVGTPPPAAPPMQVHLPAPPQAQPRIVAVVKPPTAMPQPKPKFDQKIASIQPVHLVPPKAKRTQPDEGEGDIDDNGVPTIQHSATSMARNAGGSLRNWTIQIGAFADTLQAQTQLKSYAQRSADVLAQAQRIVIPFQSVDGKTLYRARFGSFIEAEARAICERMTERGQTCFAALASAR